MKYLYKNQGEKNIVGSLGWRLVSGNYHENKVIAVMAMASNPPCFWLHFFSASTSSSNIVELSGSTLKYHNLQS